MLGGLRAGRVPEASSLGRGRVVVVKPHLTLLELNLEMFANLSIPILLEHCQASGCAVGAGCDLPGYLLSMNLCFTFPTATSPRVSSELEQARPQTSGEEELQLQLALAMSREVAEQVVPKPTVRCPVRGGRDPREDRHLPCPTLCR